MIRQSVFFGSIVAAVLAVHATPAGDAPSAISGTVKITGLASNAGAVVFVQEAPGTFPAAKPASMDQRSMKFIPHVLPIVVGTTVKFLNSDPTQHNVFSPDNEKYNLGTWPQGQTKDYAFGKCAKAPCVYTQLCRIHPEMEAFIVVLQNPYFGVTDQAGKYEIANVPAGRYVLAAWHFKGKAQSKPVSVETAKPSMVDFVLASR